MSENRKTIFKCVTGSHLYGLDTPESDIDYYEVFMEPKDWYLGLAAVHDPKGNMTVTDDVDTTRHEFRHFLRLCLNYNPNIIEVLHSPEMLSQSSIAVELYINRYKFVSQRSVKALIGYAIRMRADVLEPWRTGKQGTKRKALIDKYGFDVKAAAHAYRLSYAASKLATSGGRDHVVKVDGSLKDTLVDIRNGKIPASKVLTSMQAFIDCADSYTNTLPPEPDYGWVNNFCIRRLKEYVNG